MEYRGYDSAGIGYVLQKKLEVIKACGKLHNLREQCAKEAQALTVSTALGHTRWATHGAPCVKNAHPHVSQDGRLALVHNGIIENFLELKAELLTQGYSFQSDTDSEVLVNLISQALKEEQDLVKALQKALQRAHGAYAICVLDQETPNVLYACKQQAPLICGLGIGENFIASDIPAFLNYTREVLFLEDHELLRLTPHSYELLKLDDLTPIKRDTKEIQWSMQAAQKGGYRHFMLKEIFEQPKVITDCLAGRLGANYRVLLPELDAQAIPKHLHIVACGTSYHAGLWAAHLFQSIAKVPTTVEIASEFRYKEELLLDAHCDQLLVISQSGETADTLAALDMANAIKIPTIGLCNVLGSSIARSAKAVIYTQAGPEISVASTKAMTSQMLLLTCMALYYAQRKECLKASVAQEFFDKLQALPQILEAQLPSMQERAKQLARKFAKSQSFFYLGRGFCFPLALEGALKLKELSYIHAEGYPAGEMKHGPIALIDPTFPTFVLAPIDQLLYPKIKSNLVEIQARQGQVIALTNPGSDLEHCERWEIPAFAGPLAAFLLLPCLQLFSYEVADYLGCDVDQPRNLAKSVTVE